jgi:Putative peptidoglycan binding domain
MIHRDGRSVHGFGLGAVNAPADSIVSVLPVLVGAGTGIGVAVLARRSGTPALTAAMGGGLIGLGIAIGVSATTRYLRKIPPQHPPAQRTLPTPRGTRVIATPGGFVSLVQQTLTNAGFDTGGVDNDWGSHTSAAAIAFQTAHGMTPTGLPEPELLRALGISIPAYPNAADIAGALTTTLNGVVDPRDALKIMLGESEMNPAAVAYLDPETKTEPVAGGVFGLLVTQTQNLTGMSFSDWIQLSAAQQIPYAAKFWKQITAGFGAPLPVSARDLYWLNYLPATYVPGAPDDYVFVRSNDTFLRRGSSTWEHAAGYYTQNEGLDHPLTPGGTRKGFITAGDMGLAAARGAMKNPATYAAIADAISPEGVA